MSQKFIRVLVVASVFALHAFSASAQTIHRPIQDFIGPSLASGNFGWYDSSLPLADQTYVVFDLFGRSNALWSVNAGTTLDGTVTETVLSDGRARVQVVLHGRNVIAYARNSGGNVVFGNLPSDIAAGRDAALARTTVTIEFIVPTPREPLPGFAQLFDPSAPYQVERLLVQGTATGTLRAAFGVADGTPGRAHVTQRALFGVPGVPEHDAYPAEVVTLRAIR